MNETNLSAAPEQSAPAAAPEAAAPHEATEETVTVGALRGAIERRNAQRARRAAEEAAARWSREADELTAQCPDFDLGAALQDTQFCALLRAGVDVDFKRRKFIDVQNIFHKKEQRTLVAAYKFYCDKELDDAHSAEADTRATYEVLKAQLDRYPDLRNDVDALAEYSCRAEAADYAGRILYNEKGEEVFGFGKYRGRSVAEVFRAEPSYYAWMMNGDFPLYTKKVITEIRMRDKLRQG